MASPGSAPGAAGRRRPTPSAHPSKEVAHDEEAIEDARRLDPVDTAGRGAGDDHDAGRGATAEVRGRARLPGALGAAVLRRPPRGDVRAHPPVRPPLQHAAPGRPHRPERDQARRRPGRELDRLQGRAHLHVQAPPGRQVPRRERDDVEGRQGVLRQDHLPAAGSRVEPEGPVPVRPEVVEAPDPRTVRFRLKWPEASFILARLVPVQLHLQGGHPGQGHPLVREERHGDRALQVRRAREGLPLGGQEEPRLLGQGEALPRRLPRALHQLLVGAGGR